jgi:DNA-binding NarL/FixJ family response regulator
MKINPSARVFFSSGYTADGEIQSLIEDGAKGIIQKPYKLADLSSAIARIL